MGKLNRANLRKTLYYLIRNGVSNTWYAAKERMEESSRMGEYHYLAPEEEELERQRKQIEGWEDPARISIVVPTYCTREEYLRDLLQSVLEQTYSNWELVLADASSDESVSRIVKQYRDDRICYIRLEENKGISENTNEALAHATGAYIGLLDHDDVLTADALYQVMLKIRDGAQMIYSDEDKCNEDRTQYFEPHYKEDFNLDLLLSNNYICHFLVMEAGLMKELSLRPAYDGAQDYDLVLRAAEHFLQREELIAHIPKVLYHWRCHSASTAENPHSKQYAYEAGLRAVQDFADRQGWNATAVHLQHLGFYRLQYPKGLFRSRTDIGAVGGRVVAGKEIVGGRMDWTGKVFYQHLPVRYSGYMHRAVLSQDAEAVDIRCIRVRKECIPIFEKIVGVPYAEVTDTGIFDAATLPRDTDCVQLSIALGKALEEAGYRVLYQPLKSVGRM